MIFHRAQEKPEYHHAANCCQMLTHTFMHDMLIQIDDPGTVYSQIKAGTKLICQCSQQVILRSQHSAYVCQQDTQQNYHAGYGFLFLVSHFNPFQKELFITIIHQRLNPEQSELTTGSTVRPSGRTDMRRTSARRTRGTVLFILDCFLRNNSVDKTVRRSSQ